MMNSRQLQSYILINENKLAYCAYRDIHSLVWIIKSMNKFMWIHLLCVTLFKNMAQITSIFEIKFFLKWHNMIRELLTTNFSIIIKNVLQRWDLSKKNYETLDHQSSWRRSGLKISDCGNFYKKRKCEFMNEVSF